MRETSYLFTKCIIGSTGENRTNPNWQPFPKGLRMLAGDTTRRSYNANDVTNNAISYVWYVSLFFLFLSLSLTT